MSVGVTKEAVLAEYLKCPDSKIRTMADLEAMIQGHIRSGGGRYIVFMFMAPDRSVFGMHYNITREDWMATGSTGARERRSGPEGGSRGDLSAGRPRKATPGGPRRRCS